jgi:ketosteroid isomerase-like protein
MRPALAFTLACLASALPARAEAPAADAARLVALEQAFARDVAAHGMRRGFLAHLAPSAILFRPGPVLGRPLHEAGPETPARLEWEPWHAEMSAGGDLGWTTGPWAFRSDSAQAAVDAHGEYLSVWRRTEAGDWRVVLDGGIAHGPVPIATRPTLHTLAPGPRTGRGPLARREALWKVDADFGQVAQREGAAAALQRHGADRIILLRNGRERVVGLLAAHDTLARHDERPRVMSNAQFLSGAGDLGYTYGSWVLASAEGPDSSWYVNVWRRGEARLWELAAHMVLPGGPPRR